MPPILGFWLAAALLGAILLYDSRLFRRMSDWLMEAAEEFPVPALFWKMNMLQMLFTFLMILGRAFLFSTRNDTIGLLPPGFPV